jgi:hypothetical protein
MKKKFFLLVTVIVIAGWQHYLALVLFTGLIVLYFKSYRKALIARGLYLILGTCNLVVLTPLIHTNSYGMRIGSVELWTPGFQLLSFLILIAFGVIHFETFVNMYLDYKEAKQKKTH